MTIKYILIGGAALIALPVVGGLYSTFSSVATAPSRVINKTLQTDNIINNYEWFHDAYGQYRARVSQIEQHKRFMSEAEDSEKSRLRIELAAIQQSCRELSAQYNANATKSNRSIFMGQEAPESLSEQQCN